MFKLTCLVDNNSLNPTLFKAEHGVAFVIETPAGKILFDTGQSGKVLVHNATGLGIDLRQIDALALSHAHYDHTGGLEALLQLSQPGMPVYAHPDIFCARYSVKDGQARSIGLHMSQSALAQRTTLNLSTEPCQILPGVWTTGEITPRTEFEGRSAHHYIKTNQGWRPDPYRDDMALVLDTPAGLVLICGCCHAGLLNTLAHIQRVFANQEVTAIVGGTHLAGVGPAMLGQAIDVLRASRTGQQPELYLNHCTGENALAALAQAFGEKVHPCPAGTVLRFE